MYHVLRANFDGVSSEYVKAPEEAGWAKYEYGCNVTNVKEDEGSKEMVVTYHDRDKKERTVKAERVFAADGPSSTIRSMLLPHVERKYAGYVSLSTSNTNGRSPGEEQFLRVVFQKIVRRHSWRNFRSSSRREFKYIPSKHIPTVDSSVCDTREERVPQARREIDQLDLV